MNRFDALLQEVALLNSQPQLKDGGPGCEIRMLLHRKLWSIVSQLNETFRLGLDNCCLDLDVEGNRLRIHYWTDTTEMHPATETNLYIAHNGSIEWHVTDLATGKIEIQKC